MCTGIRDAANPAWKLERGTRGCEPAAACAVGPAATAADLDTLTDALAQRVL